MLRFAPMLPGGAWVIGLDPLSAWFLLPILAVGTAAAIYGTQYLAADRHERPTAAAHGLLAVLLVALAGVVTSQAVVPFLISWEVMAVSAFLLVIFESEKAEVRRAGLIYIVLTHTSMLALLAMFAGWSHGAADLTFESLSRTPLATGSGGLVLVLALVGFGMKAGVVPLHVWLPGAHAAAPSHVSALLSGVMLKTGIYGLLRVMNLLGVVPAWWGWTLLGLGLVSGVLGVLWALAQHDLKRLLAYHSVENVGIILLGMGVGALGVAYRQPVVAVLGFTGAVLHSLNHALFKSLLFLGAGAVVRATGTRTIDALGGVGRRMPWTAAAFLLGSVAIVGLPPLNGFVSEWIVLQALFRGGMASGPTQSMVFAAAGLGLIAALAVACFTRVTGAVFLGNPRTPENVEWKEAGPGMLAPMLALGGACVLLGIAPLIALVPASRVVAQVLESSPVAPAAGVPEVPPAALALGALAAALAGVAAGVAAVRAALARRRAPALAATWGCAYPRPSARMQYTASSFGAPLLAAFGSLVKPPVVGTPDAFATNSEDRVLSRVVGPVWARVRTAAAALRPLQQGRVTTYLQYIVFTLLVLLCVLFAPVRRL
jgi:hydrogenase-4 component B